jgi:hypothetical protein
MEENPYEAPKQVPTAPKPRWFRTRDYIWLAALIAMTFLWLFEKVGREADRSYFLNRIYNPDKRFP